jgi:hypothetical protein
MDETLRPALSENISVNIPSPQTHGRSSSYGLQALEAWAYRSVACCINAIIFIWRVEWLAS